MIYLKRKDKTFLHLPVLFCFFIWLPVFSFMQLPVDMHELAISSINSVYQDQFKQALGYTKRIIKKYPDHPAGYFFYAAVLLCAEGTGQHY